MKKNLFLTIGKCLFGICFLFILYLWAVTSPIKTHLLECKGQLETNYHFLTSKDPNDYLIDKDWTEHLYLKEYLVGSGYGLSFSNNIAYNFCHGEGRSVVCGINCDISSEKNKKACFDSWTYTWFDKDTGSYFHKSILWNKEHTDQTVYKYGLTCKNTKKVIDD